MYKRKIIFLFQFMANSDPKTLWANEHNSANMQEFLGLSALPEEHTCHGHLGLLSSSRKLLGSS